MHVRNFENGPKRVSLCGSMRGRFIFTPKSYQFLNDKCTLRFFPWVNALNGPIITRSNDPKGRTICMRKVMGEIGKSQAARISSSDFPKYLT